MSDDELSAALRDALLEPVPDVDERRVEAVRAAAAGDHDLDTIVSVSGAGTVADASRSERRRRRLLPFAAAAAAAIVLIAGGAVALRSTRQGETAGDLEYSGPIDGPAGSGHLRVVETGIGRVVDLDTEALAILPTGEYYEIWFVGDDDTPERADRISAGTFHPDRDGRSRVTFAAAVNPEEFPTVEITAEPADGDPAPTGPTVMSADISEP